MIGRMSVRTATETGNDLPVGRPYRYRDPGRLTPERIAELEARDVRLAALEGVSEPNRGRVDPGARARFGVLRGRGVSVADAAYGVGASLRQGRRWEQARKAGLL